MLRSTTVTQHGSDAMDHPWESEIALLLEELSATQTDLLNLLSEKRELLASGDIERLNGLEPRERTLAERLQACHRQREELLQKAAGEGLPSASIRELTAVVAGEQSKPLHCSIDAIQKRRRLLQHQSLTNWVVIQRTLLHLSQMIEILATGGELQPTYSKDGHSSSGMLVDQAV